MRGWYGAREQVVPLVSATAVWYHSGMPALPSRWVLGRDPQEEFDPQALLCTALPSDPIQILAWFVLRGRLEVTWQEARAYLGMETPRHWNAQAIARTIPVLLGLFFMITQWAGQVAPEPALPSRPAVWYRNVQPTFADAIAVVRQHVWTATHFPMSPAKPDMGEIPSALLKRLADTLCSAPGMDKVELRLLGRNAWLVLTYPTRSSQSGSCTHTNSHSPSHRCVRLG
jgi:hypothetical protein